VLVVLLAVTTEVVGAVDVVDVGIGMVVVDVMAVVVVGDMLVVVELPVEVEEEQDASTIEIIAKQVIATQMTPFFTLISLYVLFEIYYFFRIDISLRIFFVICLIIVCKVSPITNPDYSQGSLTGGDINHT